MEIFRLDAVRKTIESRLARSRQKLEQVTRPRAASPASSPRCNSTDVHYMLGGIEYEWLRRLRIPSVSPHPPDLHAKKLGFAARVMIAVRDKFNGDAPSVYSAARITRQAYSQIISDETHCVSKRTAIRFAFALKLTLDEANQLLRSAGYAFSEALAEDCILQACLESDPPIWDLDTVNALLKEYKVDFQY